jgi:GTPase SAR1 family protein
MENEYDKSLLVDEKQTYVRVTFADNGGEEYIGLLDGLIRMSEGILVMYSVYDKYSLEFAERLLKNIRVMKDVDDDVIIPVILVEYNDPSAQRGRSLSDNLTTEEGQELATKLNVQFTQITVNDGEAANKVFSNLIRMVLDARNPKPVPQTNKKCIIM